MCTVRTVVQWLKEICSVRYVYSQSIIKGLIVVSCPFVLLGFYGVTLVSVPFCYAKFDDVTKNDAEDFAFENKLIFNHNFCSLVYFEII
jgi:hypothetical protein